MLLGYHTTTITIYYYPNGGCQELGRRIGGVRDRGLEVVLYGSHSVWRSRTVYVTRISHLQLLRSYNLHVFQGDDYWMTATVLKCARTQSRINVECAEFVCLWILTTNGTLAKEYSVTD